MRQNTRLVSLLAFALAGAAILLVVAVLRDGLQRSAFSLLLYLVPLGMLLGGRNPRKEWEQQTAFEEAECERAERRANAVFESFIDASPISIEIYARDGKLLKSNKAAERLLGKVPPPGISLFDQRGLKRTGLLEPQLKRVLAGTRVETPPVWYDPTEIGLPGIPGKKVQFRATVFPLFDNESNVTRIAVMHEDITELKQLEQELKDASLQPPPPAQAGVREDKDVRELEFRRRKLEQALRESEEKHRAFIQGPQGYIVFHLTQDGRVAGVSPSVETVWGVSAETILTDPSVFFARIHPEDLDRVKKTEAEIREKGEYPKDYRFRVTNKNTGKIHWVEIRGSVGKVAGKKILNAIALDITHLVGIEQALKQKQADIESLVASATDGIITLDKDFTVTRWSKGAEKETGISPEGATGKPLEKVYPDIRNTGFFPVLKESLKKQTSLRHEGFYNDGREKYAAWFSISSYPFDSGLLLIIRNITRQKEAEQAWQHAEGKLTALLKSPGLAIAIKDHELRYTMANAETLRMMGVAGEDEIKGKTDADILKPAIAGLIDSHDRKVISKGETVELELALPDAKSSNAAWYRMVKCPLQNPSDKTVGILGIAYDITKRVRAQQELAHRCAYFEKLLKEQAATIQKAKKTIKHWEKP